MTVVIAGVLLSVFRASLALSGDTTGVIDGTVVDSLGNSIPRVEVTVLDSRQHARTNEGGGYRIDNVPPGPHIVRFRRIGLQPVIVQLDVEAANPAGLDVVMKPGVYQLATIEVTTPSGTVMLPRLFAQRMATGQGAYLTETDIDRRKPHTMGDVFRNVAGLTVSRDGTVRANRGVNSLFTRPCVGGMPIYVNDSYAGGGANETPGGTSTKAYDASGGQTDFLDPKDVVGIEIYRGPAEMPATLPPSVCGAIVVWTK